MNKPSAWKGKVLAYIRLALAFERQQKNNKSLIRLVKPELYLAIRAELPTIETTERFIAAMRPRLRACSASTEDILTTLLTIAEGKQLAFHSASLLVHDEKGVFDIPLES